MKINHNELLTYPNKFDQIMFGTVKQAVDMGAAAVGATIYFGSEESGAADRGGGAGVRRRRTSWAWRRCSGATCATTRSRRTRTTTSAADLTGQANHLGVTIQADIIKQKLPENNGGFKALNTGGVELRQAGRAHVHRAVAATTRSICPATRSPTATWAAPA